MPLVPITCPSCAAGLDVEERFRDWTVRCPDCRHEFVPVLPRTAPPPEEFPALPGPRDDSRPAGVGLTIVGVLQLCLCAFLVFFSAAVRPNNPPMNPNPDEEAEEITAGVVVGVVGLIQAGLMVLGAVALKNRRNYGLAMAGAVAALVPCNLCCFVAIPFGIWALVVLSRPNVRAAFRAARDPDVYEPE